MMNKPSYSDVCVRFDVSIDQYIRCLSGCDFWFLDQLILEVNDGPLESSRSPFDLESLYMPFDSPQQQRNDKVSNDCGVLMCKFRQSRVLNGLPSGIYRAEFAFTSRDTTEIRQEMLA